MARQTGIIKLKGTLDDISFYKSSNGHLAPTKGGIDATVPHITLFFNV